MLTDPEFVRRLESLYLLARKVLGGNLQAERKSTKKGSGITFADYSEYSLGDDYRAIDWRVYARFESLVIKLFEIDEDTTIYILLDCSRSMESKFLYAKQLAAALGYIALSSLDRVALYSVADKLNPLIDPSRGRGKIFPFLRALDDAATTGTDTSFTTCTKQFQARHSRKGIVIVISDFLFPNGYDRGLKFLQWNRHDIYNIQIQNKNDLKCDWKGDCQLHCVESDQNQRVTITPREAKLYEKAIARWNEDLKKSCARLGIGHVFTTNETPFETVIQNILRKGGLVT